MTFMDRSFLFRVSGAAMSAAFSGGVTWFATLCLPLGICAYASTFVSQYYGDDQPEKIGSVVLGKVCGLRRAFTPLMLGMIPPAGHLRRRRTRRRNSRARNPVLSDPVLGRSGVPRSPVAGVL